MAYFYNVGNDDFWLLVCCGKFFRALWLAQTLWHLDGCCLLHALHLEYTGLFSVPHTSSPGAAAFTLNLSPIKWIKSSFPSRFGLSPHILGLNCSTLQSMSLPFTGWSAWKQAIWNKNRLFCWSHSAVVGTHTVIGSGSGLGYFPFPFPLVIVHTHNMWTFPAA